MLENLKKSGVILAVATSKPTVYAKRILEHSNLDKYFDVIVGSNLDNTITAKNEVICCVLEELKIESNKEVIMIGDRKHEIIGAKKNNNMDSICVIYGFGSKAEMDEIEPTYRVENCNEILEIIEGA